MSPPDRTTLTIKQLKFENNVTYTGHVNERDEKHGIGKLVCPGKFEYSGHFRNGVIYGVGKMKYPDGTQYDGQFKDEKYDGKGKLIYPNSEVYLGEFKNGLRHGRGLYYNSDGSLKHVGRYINDKYYPCCFICC
jgi:hypothetical protein